MTVRDCVLCVNADCKHHGTFHIEGTCNRYIQIREEDLPTYRDDVRHPEHYTFGDIECFDAMEAQMTPEEFRGYLRGCVIKYVWRYRHKGGVMDLKKAEAYLGRLIEKVRDEATFTKGVSVDGA